MYMMYMMYMMYSLRLGVSTCGLQAVAKRTREQMASMLEAAQAEGRITSSSGNTEKHNIAEPDCECVICLGEFSWQDPAVHVSTTQIPVNTSLLLLSYLRHYVCAGVYIDHDIGHEFRVVSPIEF